MRDKILIPALFLMFFGALFPLANPAISQTKMPAKKDEVKTVKDKKDDTEQGKFALLIGVNDYVDKNISDLSGCENDVKLVGDALGELYGFKSGSDIKELTTSNKKAADKPTRDGILDAFKQHLIENAKRYKEDNKLTADKGATIVFYYSGHGSYLPDQPGSSEEADGMDETIVPMDSDVKGSRDIRDDEINDLFAELRKYTTNITFIFDSCHSGTATRGFGTRSIERSFGEAKSRDGGDGVPLNETMDESESYVTISGSLPNEKSQEDFLPSQNDVREKVKKPQKQMNGYLTYYLVQELRNTPDATYSDVMQRVKSAVTKKNSAQHPQAEGDIERVFLGSKESRGRKAIAVKESKKDGKDTLFTIDAGRIVGAFPGGTVAIYDSKARELAGNTDFIGSGMIIEPTDDFTATVRASEKDVPKNAKIVLANPYFSDEKRPVALDVSDSPMIKQLSEKLETNDYVKPQIVKDLSNQIRALGNRKTSSGQRNSLAENDWKIAVVRGKFKEFTLGNRQASKDTNTPKDDDEVYFLADNNGNSLYNFYVRADDANADEEITAALEKFVRVENLLTLGNAAASETNQGMLLKLIKLKSAAAPSVGSKDCNVVEDPKAQSSVLNPGEFFYLEITNNTGEKMYPYLYSISTSGEIKLLYPPPGAEDALSDKTSIKTWGARKCMVYKASAPYGTETFKLVATTKPFNGKLLESTAIAKGMRGNASPLERLFAQAALNQRNTETLNLSPNSWATASVNAEIKPAVEKE